MSKSFHIPECPRLSKYDGFGMAAMSMIQKERNVNRRDHSCEGESYDSSDSYNKGYWEGYLEGYEACRDELYDSFEYIEIDHRTIAEIKREVDENYKDAKDQVKDFMRMFK